MRLEIRRLTAYERDRIRRAVLADMEERGDLGCSRREWISDTFDEIRTQVTSGRWSLDLWLGHLLVGPRLRRHNRQVREAAR